MLDIARRYVEGFLQLGLDSQLALDRLPEAARLDRLQLVVAPHEFFPLFVERLHGAGAVTWALVVFSYLLYAQQPVVAGFDRTRALTSGSLGVLRHQPEGTNELCRRGLDATWMRRVDAGFRGGLFTGSMARSTWSFWDTRLCGLEVLCRSRLFLRTEPSWS